MGERERERERDGMMTIIDRRKQSLLYSISLSLMCPYTVLTVIVMQYIQE